MYGTQYSWSRTSIAVSHKFIKIKFNPFYVVRISFTRISTTRYLSIILVLLPAVYPDTSIILAKNLSHCQRTKGESDYIYFNIPTPSQILQRKHSNSYI